MNIRYTVYKFEPTISFNSLILMAINNIDITYKNKFLRFLKVTHSFDTLLRFSL